MAYTTIDKPTDYFNTKLYTGNATDDHSITGVGFQPDWVWVKGRSEISSHRLNDSVRGAGKELLTNTTDAEYTYSPNTSLKSFDSDGFTLGTDNGINKNSVTYASWNWLKSTTSGFDIVLYTGNASGSARAISHSLGATPAFMITKHRTGTQVTGTNNWNIFHKSFSAGDYIHFTTGAKANASAYWGNTLPTSSNFYVGGTSANVHNESGVTYVAYLFAEKKGYSKFGSYIGNSSASDGSYIDGTYVHCGFRPAFIMAKATTRSENWYIFDNKRDGINPDNQQLYADTTSAEGTTDYIDITSNGFRLVQKNFGLNSNGDTYIFMAFAESPFVTSTGIPCLAR